MKKIISIILATVLTLTCLNISSLVFGQGSEAVARDPDDKLITVFDSNAYYKEGNKHVNPDLVTSNDLGYWLGGGSWRSSSASNQVGLYMGKGGESAKILARNGAAITNVDDFEWQFQIIADDASKVHTSFVFHVNDSSNISSYSTRANLFAVTLYGSGYKSEDARFQIPSSLVAEYSNGSTNSGMRPFDYDTSVTPWQTKANSYVKLDDASAENSINLADFTTVNIQMSDRLLTISVWQTDDKEATLRTISMTMYTGGYKLAKSGDFAIISGDNSCNYKITDMNISTPREIFNSADYPAPTHLNPYVTDGKTWLGGNSWVSGNASLKDSIYMGLNGGSAKIVERNEGRTPLADFEWQMQFIADSATMSDMKTSFVFHINENSDISSFSARKNVLAVTLYGTNVDMSKNCAVGGAFVVEYSASGRNNQLGYMRPYNYNSSVTPWTISADSYKKLDDSSAAKAVDISKYVTLNIKMVGRDLTVSFWQSDDKASTYRELKVKMHTSAMTLAPEGDFAIISRHDEGLSTCNYRIKDMTIKAVTPDINVPTPDYASEDLAKPTEGVYFENDFEENQNGVVVATHPKYPEQTGIKTEGENSYLQSTQDFSNANGKDGWNIINITPDKKYKDFTLNFKVKLDPKLQPTYHQNWHYMLVGFRSTNGVVSGNVLQIAAGGAAFSVADSASGKDYTNNRIGYAGDNSTLDGTFKLPNGKISAGIAPDNVWHKVSLVVSGWNYKYYLDGQLMLEVKDPQQLYKKGKLVIAARTLNLQLDDIEVLTPDAEISPFEPQQTQTGLLYANDFDTAADADSLTVIRGQNYGIVTDGDKSYYHIDYEPDASNPANGNVNMTFGPVGIKNFTLSMQVRITKNISDKWHNIILMGRTKAGGISAQGRFLTKGSMIVGQKDSELLEIARSGPAATGTTSTYPCHDKNAGVSILEWHKITLVCDEWNYTIYIDGKKIAEGVDEHQLSKWGGFGLRTQGVNLDIDNIRIWGTPHYDLSFTEEIPTGQLYKNDFEAGNMDGISFTYYDESQTAILKGEDGNSFLRAYPDLRTDENGKLKVVGNGNLLFSFGPPNAMDFTLTFKVREMSNTNENLGSVIVGIHSDPTNIKWDTVWANILPRGTSFSLKDSTRKLGIDNLIGTTGKNRSGGNNYMPSDNRAFGLRPDGKWHDVKVVSKGYTYTVYVDGAEILTATDTDKTFYKGYTVIGSNGCIIDIDDISLTNK